jgi:hypothetical protein
MSISTTREVSWLLLVLSLPARSASQRVQGGRKIQRYGMLPLHGSGYVLPNTAQSRERMEWLATATYKERASVAQVQSFADLPSAELRELAWTRC